MPMTVVTLTNVPSALRGDLTKWLQEISVGVYVGNINSRVREQLWNRIIDNINLGQATMTFWKSGELGYDFKIFNTKREVVYNEGIPLVLIPLPTCEKENLKRGFSKAAKLEKAKRYMKSNQFIDSTKDVSFIIIDVETTGLHADANRIIEIAALKVTGEKIATFQSFIQLENNNKIPKEIMNMTNITDEMLDKYGKPAEVVCSQFTDFVGDGILIGYNIKFDIDFINNELKRNKKAELKNKTICLMKLVKKEREFLLNYKLDTVLKEYSIVAKNPHRAFSDVEAEYELALKLNIFQQNMRTEC